MDREERKAISRAWREMPMTERRRLLRAAKSGERLEAGDRRLVTPYIRSHLKTSWLMRFIGPAVLIWIGSEAGRAFANGQAGRGYWDVGLMVFFLAATIYGHSLRRRLQRTAEVNRIDPIGG
jgi:hypothetical protein